MKSTEATVFDRKSGAAEGPAVRPGSRTKISVPLVLPQNRHPERSALTDLSRDTALVARSRRARPERSRRNLGGTYFHPYCSELSTTDPARPCTDLGMENDYSA